MPTESDARSGDRWNIAVKRSAGWSKMLRRCRLIIAEGTLCCFGLGLDGRFPKLAGVLRGLYSGDGDQPTLRQEGMRHH